ncbi:two-component response regulator [Pedobacter sp. BAL39]|uniref:response regulator n=1 Tax=Pedobacter sp. BAL39 TaxID=391596 RepID=UPI000155945E|nr:response regulator [Pedobacter sp. BAL39]EDM35180.1 two-component response regulator [Pedobacter sp. BAL39]
MQAMTQRARILVVEDDHELTTILKEIFNEVGYEVVTLNDARDIVPLVRQIQPWVVLMDYLLPTTNGGELCRQIKQDKTTQPVPVIICSGLASDELPLAEIGCNGYLPKPFDLDELVRQVEKAMRGHKADLP